MHVEHRPDRTIVDTGPMAAIAHRTRWSVRAVCERGPDGYDVDTCAAALQARPGEPVLVTSAQAWERYGVKAATVRQWAHRNHLVSHDRNEWGHPLYDAGQVQRLARRAQLDP